MGFRRLLLLPLASIAAAVAVVLAVVLPFACSSPAPLAASGQPCFQATDCMEGLVCLPLPPQCNGNRVCSSDLTCVQSVEFDAGADGGAADAAPTGSDAAPPLDTGTAKDSAAPKDTGSGTKDTGTPPPEAGGG